MYVCEREREKNRERIGNLPARPIDENRDWIRKPGHWGALTSTQSIPPRISTLYRSLLLSSVSQTRVQREWETEKDFVCLCLLKTEGSCHVWSRRVVVFVTTEFTTVSNLVTRNFAPILVWDYLNFMMIHCYVQNQ